jgi:hypothetical protein
MLGPVGAGITADQVGTVAVAASGARTAGGRLIHIGDQAEIAAAHKLLAG